MTDEFVRIVDDVAGEVEIIGFETTLAVESSDNAPKLPVRIKPQRRRVVKAPKRSHPVRVMLDDDELLKLNVQAKAQGMALPEFVRRRALRDPRLRTCPATLAADDLFARDKTLEVAVAPSLVSLPPDLERRINAYFLPDDRALLECPKPAPTRFLARLGYFMAALVGPRGSGHRAAPPAGS